MKNYFRYIEEEYRGSHTAPNAESGSPLHDLTDTYPDDIYSSNAAHYYGDRLPYDNEAVSIIQSAKSRPNKLIKIYRAVPKILSNQEKIDKYENEKKYILKYGRTPKSADNPDMHRSDYYDYISEKIEELKSLPQEKYDAIKINPGDWVTITFKYARQHGLSNLGGKYRIITKTVPAKHLYTHGDSIHEWGYDPR